MPLQSSFNIDRYEDELLRVENKLPGQRYEDVRPKNLETSQGDRSISESRQDYTESL